MNSYEIPDKVNPAGRLGLAFELHVRFFGEPVPLFIVAPLAGTDHVLPAVRSAQVPGQDVIDGQWAPRCAAILALVAVPLEDVLAGQHDTLVGYANEVHQPDDTGPVEHRVHAPHRFRVFVNDLRLAQKHEDYRPPCRANTQGLVVLVQNEDMLAYHALHAFPDPLFLPCAVILKRLRDRFPLNLNNVGFSRAYVNSFLGGFTRAERRDSRGRSGGIHAGGAEVGTLRQPVEA